jgi:DNA (cytosine-5)-methyltransferase 1
MDTSHQSQIFNTYRFYEFFAGGGMARAGLGENWACLFANDFDRKKSHAYQANWGAGVLKTADVRTLQAADIPGHADLAWASFPCQDLSLAGGGAGLKGDRSGTFWPFWALMRALVHEGRGPSLIVLENVCGALASHGGQDFAAIAAAFQKAGYQFGALVIDAALFVPHSRPRLFMIGVRKALEIPSALRATGASAQWHPLALLKAFDKLARETQAHWIWWRLPAPPLSQLRFADLIEDQPSGVAWHSPEETARLLAMMSAAHRAKVEQAQSMGRRMVGAIYKRTRLDENGIKAQRAEIRFDGLAGCLRTPAGGSSRQLIVVVHGGMVKSRLISSRETARLMGLPDDYVLPEKYNEAYRMTGDGVVVPVVRHLAAQLLEPLLAANVPALAVAA